MLLFGNSEYAVRLLSVITGVFTIAAVYHLAKYLFNGKVGLISAFLISISAFHARYSQETRGYSLLALLSVMSVLLFIKFIYSKREKSYPFLFISIALIYTHTYGIFVIIVEAIYYYSLVLTKSPILNTKKNVTHNLLKIALAYLPWTPVLIFQFLKVQTGFVYWIKKPNFNDLLLTFWQHSGSVYNSYISFNLFVFLILIFVAFLASITKKKKLIISDEEKFKNNRKPIYLMLLWFLFPIIILFAASQKAASIFDIKSTIAFSAPFIILSSYGITKLSNKFLKIAAALIITILSILSLNTLYFSEKETKEQWREACSYLANECNKEDVIIVEPGYYKRYVFDYYYKNQENKIVTIEKKGMVNKEIDSVSRFEYSPEFWLISSTDNNYMVNNYFRSHNIYPVYSKIFKGVGLFKFQKRKN